jgi:hypothetical protein
MQVRKWLKIAATVPGFIGFAIGRTDFWKPLVGWQAKRATREARRHRGNSCGPVMRRNAFLKSNFKFGQ